MADTMVTIEIQGLTRMIQTLTGPILIGDALKRAFELSGIAVSNEAKSRAPVFRGRLRQSIKWRTSGEPITNRVEIGPNVDYAIHVHNGRRPGSWPPLAPIALWVRRKQLSVSPYLVQRKIALKGIPPKPFLADGMRAAEPAVRSAFDQAASQIGATWASQGGR